jgi:nucleoside-diphosphate-sugar epimerase
MAIESILVTGSSGTIGTPLVETLLDRGYEVHGVDFTENRWSTTVDEHSREVDLRDPDALEYLPDDIDLVVHLAAWARVHRLVQNPARAKQNLDTTFNVLEFARSRNADVLFGSSREVYGNTGQLIYDETDTFIDNCESPYTASKVGGEAMVNAYQNCYDMDSTIVRFSNVYGKYDASDRVVPLFIAQAHAGEDLVVYGDDKVLDFTYIEDCVDGLVGIVQNYHKSRSTTFNIASGQGASIVELAETVRETVNPDIDIHVEGNRTGEVARYVADISKAEKVFGYDPDYSFEAGVNAAVEWYREREHLFEEIRE